MKDYENFKIEVKYIEAAIEALCMMRNKTEDKESIKDIGTAILNIAIKTKHKFEEKYIKKE